MYGLTKDTDLEFLVGQTLLQIGIGEHDLQLIFDSASISIEGSISINNVLYDRIAVMGSALGSLPGAVVRRAFAPGNGDLQLELSGATIVLHDSKSDYESYSIAWDGQQIIV